MGEINIRKKAEEEIKIYVPGSIASASEKKSTELSESEDVRIYYIAPPTNS